MAASYVENNVKEYEGLVLLAAYSTADLSKSSLDGGCHAYFGMYGYQKGDGVPEISNEEQISKTADLITNFIY